MEDIPLLCPGCLNRIERLNMAYRCNVCMHEYPVRDGVVCFLKENNKFYEGTYDSTVNITFNNEKSLKAILFFDLYRDPYLRAIRKYTKAPEDILDIGCSGGIKYLAQKNRVAGLDLSFNSLRKAAKFYNTTVQADCLKLPFPDETFDKVINSYIFEHISNKGKRILLTQINRVLKYKGLIIFIFDCDNNNPLFRYFKKDTALYKKCFIERNYHYGLEMASENIRLISQAGFSILEYRALNKTPLQYLPVYDWMEPYKNKSRILSFVNSMAKWARKSKLFWVPYYTALSWFDTAIEKLFPLNYARILLVVAQKSIAQSNG